MLYIVKFNDGTTKKITFNSRDAFKWFLGMDISRVIKVIGYKKVIDK